MPAEHHGRTLDAARVDRLLAMLCSARVGGRFWDERHDPWATTVSSASGDDERVAIAAIRGLPLTVSAVGVFGTPATGPDPDAVARHLLLDTRYRNPFTGEDIEAEDAIGLLDHWRRVIESNRQIAVAMGMAWWKRREMATFLWSGRPEQPRFVRSDAAGCRLARAVKGGIAVWPSRMSAGLSARAARQQTPIIRVEDGFIRSVGLGSALFPPHSITVDPLGIHYDPTAPSLLEQILESSAMPPALLARAVALRQTIVDQGIGKYGGRLGATLPPRQSWRKLVLVTGQVSDDLSVRSGGGDVAGNADLLARARALEPDAEIWFRPHPDVDAGHRRGAIPDGDALRHADRVIRDGAMSELLDHVDSVHVLTSLSGFEALLRGRHVTTHGTPFYAGWGLTRDLAAPVSRRTRRLALDELVAGALILYPRYLDPVTGLPCPVETLLARIASGLAPERSWLHRLRHLQGRLIARCRR